MTARKTRVLKVLEGHAGHRPVGDAPRVQPSWEPPECPTWLPAAAKAEWRRVLPELEAAGLVTKLDRGALTAYCASWARWVAAEREIAKNGVLVLGYRGPRVKNPAVQIARDAMTQMLAAGDRLGLSPKARESISVTTIDEDEDDDLFDS